MEPRSGTNNRSRTHLKAAKQSRSRVHKRGRCPAFLDPTNPLLQHDRRRVAASRARGEDVYNMDLGSHQFFLNFEIVPTIPVAKFSLRQRAAGAAPSNLYTPRHENDRLGTYLQALVSWMRRRERQSP